MMSSTGTATAGSATGIRGGSPTLFVQDVPRAVAFYTKVLGFGLLYDAGPHFAMIDAGGGFQIGLHPPAENAPPPGTPGAIQIGLTIDRPIGEVVQTLQARGVQFQPVNGRIIKDDGAVNLAFFTDPDGHVLYLCEVKHGS